MQRAHTEKKQQLYELIVKIREYKHRVDEKYNQEKNIHEKLDSFLSQYQLDLGELDKQKNELRSKIQYLRSQLEALQQATSDGINNLDEIIPSTDMADVQDGGQQSIGNNYEPISSIQNESAIDEQTRIIQDGKDEIRKHFARFWHPDMRQEQNKADLMTQLNVAFDISADPSEMLVAIPWDVSWQEPNPGETIGEQWSRLMEWFTYLKIADEKLDLKLTQVQQYWRYPLIVDWDRFSHKQDFFIGYVDQKREEINSLENTYSTLLQQLHNTSHQKEQSNE